MSETWQEMVDVDYTYECPTDNYVGGTTTETITENYNGPARLVALVDKELKTVEVTLREWEAYDGRPDRLNCDNVVIDCSVDTLVCEVLSDYHNNHLDMGTTNPNNSGEDVLHITDIYPDGVEEDPREHKTISTPDGYSEFTWSYPIHPDELYDSNRTTYENGAWNLYKNTNEDIVGITDWDEIRDQRTEHLMSTDGFAAATDVPASLHDPVIEFRQLLRDLPEALKDIDEVFIPSSFPPTKILEK
jgi:hypothetical protein